MEVLAARFVQKFADARELLDDRLIFGNFAVEDAQRIGHCAALAIGAHIRRNRLERLPQSFVVLCAIIGASDRIQLKRPALDPEAIKQCREQF